jgi:hypothetical protein
MVIKHRVRGVAAALAGLVVVVSAVAAPAASADDVFGIASLGASASNLDGTFSRQAGAHPDLRTRIRFNRYTSGPLVGEPVGNVRDVVAELPPGVTADPTVAGTCAQRDLAIPGGGSNCPIGSQVGTVIVEQSDGFNAVRPLVSMEHGPDAPALLGFEYLSATVFIEPHVRPSDYGITALSPRISQGIRLVGADVTLWGVPADPVHDAQRFMPNNPTPGVGTQAPRRAFTNSPTSCPDAALVTTFSADSWQDPGVFESRSLIADFDGTPFVGEGCENVPFDPSVEVQPLSHAADAPTGLDVDLRVPQDDAPDGLSTAHVKKVVTTLPVGMSVSASAAAGQGACAPDQIGLGTDLPVTCPDSSKVGTVEVHSPLLEEPLQGDVILAKQNDNPFGSLLALYIVANGPGFVVKLPGRVDTNAVTGQLTATFDNNPQLPFDKLHVRLRGGSLAPLATPAKCGTYTTHTQVTSWASDVPVERDSSMVIDEGCEPGPFSPSFGAGSDNPVAGADSPFSLTVARRDRDQVLKTIDDVSLPTGLLGRVASVPLCGEADAAAGTCPAASRIGRVEAAAGVGALPLAVPQPGKAGTSVSLTGPYKGAPYGLSVVVPAQAGPFDLGTVVVRSALHVDPVDAHVTAKTDPLPHILQGIPLRVREIRLVLDRAGFTFNPTSCAKKLITGVIGGLDGGTAAVSAQFQIADCASLALKPKLALALTGRKQLTDGKHPGVKAVLTQPKGVTNLDKVKVRLPLSLALDPNNAGALCEFVDGSRIPPVCPEGSIVGRARAVTPVLSEPLSGPVYFVKNVRKDPKTGRDIRTLPKLVIPLEGAGVRLVLTGTSSVEKTHLVSTFDNIPDAPVSRFDLTIDGGKKGILVVNGKACKRSRAADVAYDGHNGKTLDRSLKLAAPCAKSSRHHAAKKRAGKRTKRTTRRR